MQVVELDLSALGKRFSELENALDGRLTIVVAAEGQAQARALRDFLKALAGERDPRSTLRASIDAWRLRYFAALLGLAERRGYGWRVEERDDLAAVVLTPRS